MRSSSSPADCLSLNRNCFFSRHFTTAADPCGASAGSSWVGITCNALEPSGVTGITLRNAAIYADLTDAVTAFAQLGTLQSINLAQNSLYNAIPSALGQLVSLTSINLEKNFLQGTLPSDIGLLTNLVTLDLSNCQLDGVLPPALSRATSLKVLDLVNNTYLCGALIGISAAADVEIEGTNITVGGGAREGCPTTATKQSDRLSLDSLSTLLASAGPLDASWGSADPCSQSSGWKGVTCSGAGDVQGVNLTGEGVEGHGGGSISSLLQP